MFIPPRPIWRWLPNELPFFLRFGHFKTDAVKPSLIPLLAAGLARSRLFLSGGWLLNALGLVVG